MPLNNNTKLTKTYPNLAVSGSNSSNSLIGDFGTELLNFSISGPIIRLYTRHTASRDIPESRNIAPATDSKRSPRAFGTSTSSASSISSSRIR